MQVGIPRRPRERPAMAIWRTMACLEKAGPAAMMAAMARLRGSNAPATAWDRAPAVAARAFLSRATAGMSSVAAARDLLTQAPTPTMPRPIILGLQAGLTVPHPCFR